MWRPDGPKPPCAQQPDWFMQPGEARNWATLPDTRTAVSWCWSRCDPVVFTECARFALRSGWIGVEGVPRPASGVVMAGVVCNGGDKTERELRAALSGAAPPPPRARPEVCVNCGRAMSTKARHAPGTVVHESQGRCVGCARQARRQEAS